MSETTELQVKGDSFLTDSMPLFRVVRSYFRMPPGPGGMEAHIARLSEAQRALGVDVINLYNSGVAEGVAVKLFSGFDLSCVRPAVLRNSIFYLGALTVRQQLKGKAPTVLHVHGDWSDFMLSKILARAIGAKVVVASVHDTVSERKKLLLRMALSHCDLVFTTGKRDQIFLEKLLNRIVYHLPSAPNDLFFEKPEVRQSIACDVITVANFFPKKRIDIVLECARRRPQLTFAVYGSGPGYEAIVLKARIGNINNIAFPGRCSYAQVAKALQGAKLFLLTSEREGTPTVALEAMAAGLPVVLTPSNDYGWLVEAGVNGFVTSTWDVKEILVNIDDVLSDDLRRVAMGLAGRDRVFHKYTWRANTARVNTLMAESLGLEWEDECHE